LISQAQALVLLLTALALLAGRVRSRRWAPGDELLPVGLAFLAAYFLSPKAVSNGSELNWRLLLFPYFTLILWFAAQPFPPWARRTLQGTAAAAALAQLGLYASTYAVLDGYLLEYTSAMCEMEPQTTFLPVNFNQTGLDASGRPLSERVAPFWHAGGYIGAERRAIDLQNYEGFSHFFPVHFRPEKSPYLYLGAAPDAIGRGLLATPPRVDVANFTNDTGERVDYLLVWGQRREHRDTPEARDIRAQIEQGYERIFVSPQRGLVELYRRKDFAPDGKR
jgi:hypothetical protein